MSKKKYNFKVTTDAKPFGNPDRDHYSTLTGDDVSIDVWGFRTQPEEVKRIADRVKDELNTPVEPKPEEFDIGDLLSSTFVLILLVMGVWKAGELFSMLIF